MAVSERMARWVERYLVRVGIDKKRIQVTAYGFERPICKGLTPACRKSNNRVELRLE